MTIEEKLSIIIRDALDIDMEEVTPDMDLRKDLGMNESNAMTLYFAIREHFPNFSMRKEDADTLITVADAIDFFKDKIGEK